MSISNVLFRNSDGDHEVSASPAATLSDFTTGNGIEGVNYFASVADGAIAKGDVVYFTAGKVKTWSNLTELRRPAGIAAAAAADGAAVHILKNQQFLSSALTGATVGARQFWTGSGYQESPVTGTGKYQVQGGFASSATQLFTFLAIVDKNS